MRNDNFDAVEIRCDEYFKFFNEIDAMFNKWYGENICLLNKDNVVVLND
jgi:hypothetical protein